MVNIVPDTPTPRPATNGVLRPVDPVARITVDLLPGGKIGISSSSTDAVFVLGLLEMAQAQVIRDTAEPTESRIVPAHSVPR